MFNLAEYKLKNGKYMSHTELGMYPVYYVCADWGILCADCVDENQKIIEEEQVYRSDKQWLIMSAQVNDEDINLICSHCHKKIESAYGEDNG